VRWPWRRPEVAPLTEEPDVPDQDPADPTGVTEDSSDALRRAQQALRRAETTGRAMHEVTGQIRRERQTNHFSELFFDSMRRKKES
jgi:hypothetical protein